MSRPKKVFIDANVFVAPWTFDALLTLADAGLIEPRWSDEVIREARRAIERLGGPRRKGGHIDAAEAAYPYANVPIEPADLEGMALPDPDDRHVVAGARVAECDIITTYNMKDFPQTVLEPYGLRAAHPDELLTELAESDPATASAAIRLLVSNKKHPPRSMAEEIAGLRRNNLTRFAEWLENNK